MPFMVAMVVVTDNAIVGETEHLVDPLYGAAVVDPPAQCMPTNILIHSIKCNVCICRMVSII